MLLTIIAFFVFSLTSPQIKKGVMAEDAPLPFRDPVFCKVNFSFPWLTLGNKLIIIDNSGNILINTTNFSENVPPESITWNEQPLFLTNNEGDILFGFSKTKTAIRGKVLRKKNLGKYGGINVIHGTNLVVFDPSGNLILKKVSTSFLDNFKYVRQIDIKEQSGVNFSNCSIHFIIDTASLISSGKLKNDCSDIRFTLDDFQTSLPYWIEYGCNTHETKIWVKIPSIPANGIVSIYMFYGNNSVLSASNPDIASSQCPPPEPEIDVKEEHLTRDLIEVLSPKIVYHGSLAGCSLPGCSDYGDKNGCLDFNDSIALVGTSYCNIFNLSCIDKRNELNCNIFDGWYGGGNKAGCGDDPACELRDYYSNENCSCDFFSCETKDFDTDDACSGICNPSTGNIEIRDCYAKITGNNCVEECIWTPFKECEDKCEGETSPSPFYFDNITDYDLCQDGDTDCPVSQFADTCESGDYLLEYYCQGNDATYSTINCNDYDNSYCSGDIRVVEDYYCSGGSCEKNITQEDCNQYDEIILYCNTTNGDIYANKTNYGCHEGECVLLGYSIHLHEDCNKCSDSDGGKIYTQKGTVSVIPPCSSGDTSCPAPITYEDYCIDSTTLREYYCSANDVEYVDVNCNEVSASCGMCFPSHEKPWLCTCYSCSCKDGKCKIEAALGPCPK